MNVNVDGQILKSFITLFKSFVYAMHVEIHLFLFYSYSELYANVTRVPIGICLSICLYARYAMPIEAPRYQSRLL